MTKDDDAPDAGQEEITFEERDLSHPSGAVRLGVKHRVVRHEGDPFPFLEYEDGVRVPHVDYFNSLPWVFRRRLPYEEFCDHCRDRGLPRPSLGDWQDTFNLAHEEVLDQRALEDLLIERSIGYPDELHEYFFVRRFGDKPRVCWRQADGLLGHMSPAEFKSAYIEKIIEVGTDDKGKPRHKPLAEWWLRDHRTPRYTEVEFLPGKLKGQYDSDIYNLWAGWPAGLARERDLKVHILGDPIPDEDEYDGFEYPPKCERFLDHLQDNACGGDDEVFEYVLGWMADALQRPGLCETAIAMTGPSGSGKGTIANLFGSFFGPHYLSINSKEKLVGKFNRHLMEAQLVFADEVDFKNDDQASKTLRNLVTEPTLQVEPKGVDAFVARKWFRVMLASNDEHILSALHDDRRYLVLNVDAGEHNQDRDYFGAIRQEWESGGKVALFRWLTGRWWHERLRSGEWHVGRRPVTAALQRQKQLSLPPFEQFLLGVLEEGRLPGRRPNNGHAPRGTILSNSQLHDGGLFQCMRASSPRLRDWSDHALGRELGKWDCKRWKSGSERGWTFPPLGEMRAAWERRFGDCDWSEGEAEWAEDDLRGGEPF